MRGQNVRRPVSPWTVVPAEALWAGKAKPYSEYMSSPVETKCHPSRVWSARCNQPATRPLFGLFKNSVWSPLPVAQPSGSSRSHVSQDCPWPTEALWPVIGQVIQLRKPPLPPGIPPGTHCRRLESRETELELVSH